MPMHITEENSVWLLNLLQGLFLEFAPLIVLFLFPLAALVFAPAIHRISSRALTAAMLLESLTFSFPWNWGNGQSNTGSGHVVKKLRKKHALPDESNGNARPGMFHHEISNVVMDDTTPEIRTLPSEGWYPGLVNASGTNCFMNSTLQASTAPQRSIHYSRNYTGNGFTFLSDPVSG